MWQNLVLFQGVAELRRTEQPVLNWKRKLPEKKKKLLINEASDKQMLFHNPYGSCRDLILVRTICVREVNTFSKFGEHCRAQK